MKRRPSRHSVDCHNKPTDQLGYVPLRVSSRTEMKDAPTRLAVLKGSKFPWPTEQGVVVPVMFVRCGTEKDMGERGAGVGWSNISRPKTHRRRRNRRAIPREKEKLSIGGRTHKEGMASGKCGKNFIPHDSSNSPQWITTPYILAITSQRRARFVIRF